MIPIRIQNARPGRALVTKYIVALNVLVFAYELWLGAAVDTVVMEWGLVPARFLTHLQVAPWEIWVWAPPLFTHMFLHGGWLHIIGNMWFLWVFGRCLEKPLGPWKMLVLYFVGGVLASLAHASSVPTSTAPMVGASGAVAAVLGAFLVTSPLRPVLTVVPIFIFPLLLELPAAVVLVLWFLEQLLAGFFSLSVTAGTAAGVAWWAHIGGFVVGILLMRYLNPEAEDQDAARDAARAEEGEQASSPRTMGGYELPRFWRPGGRGDGAGGVGERHRSSRASRARGRRRGGSSKRGYDLITVYDRYGRPIGKYLVPTEEGGDGADGGKG